MSFIIRMCLVMLSLIFAGHSQATPPNQFNYMLNCQGCHLPDGSGFPARNVPDMRDQLASFLWVDGGREFIVQVPGSAQSDLNNEDLANLLNWMLIKFSPNEVPKDFEPYSASEVGQLRKTPLIHVTQIRNSLLEKIAAHE